MPTAWYRLYIPPDASKTAIGPKPLLVTNLWRYAQPRSQVTCQSHDICPVQTFARKVRWIVSAAVLVKQETELVLSVLVSARLLYSHSVPSLVTMVTWSLLSSLESGVALPACFSSSPPSTDSPTSGSSCGWGGYVCLYTNAHTFTYTSV